MQRVIHLTEKEDFLFRMVAKEGLTEVAETNPLTTDNTFAWNNDYNALHLKKTNTVTGLTSIPIGFLQKGDTVTVELEYWNISGSKPIIVLDYRSDDRYLTPNGSSPQYQANSSHEDGFKTSKLTIYAEKDSRAVVSFGTTYPTTAEFYVRNVSITVHSLSGKNTPQKEVQRTKQYAFTLSNTGVVLQTDKTWDTCTVSIDSTNKVIKITHDQPFTGQKTGIGFAESYASQSKYDFLTRAENQKSIEVRILDRETREFIDPALYSGSTYWFFLWHVGYDVV